METFLEQLGSKKARIMIKYGKTINNILVDKKTYFSLNCKEKFDVKFQWEEYDNCFNANCKKENTDITSLDSYIIKLNVYTPAYLEQYLKKHKIPKNYQSQIINTILEFIISHEYCHIAFGHCTLSEDEQSRLDNSVKRKFENMCDMKGIDTMFPKLDLCIKHGGYNIIGGYSSLLVCLFIYFQLIEEITLSEMRAILVYNENVQAKKIAGPKRKYKSITSNERNHPFITFRFDNICMVIENHIRKMLSCLDSSLLIDTIFLVSINMLEDFGFDTKLKICPFYRKNNKSRTEDLDIDYLKLCQIVKKVYIK